MKRIVFAIFYTFLQLSALGQCPDSTVLLFEDFEGPSPIPGAVTSNIYGGGSYNSPAYIISGSNHGWFNVINGLGNVDVYDRSITGFCQDSAVQVSFWTRESFGNTSATYSVIDDFGAVLATTTLTLTNVYQQIVWNFPATTPGLRFVIHCNSTGGSGIDICVEDILITQCVTAPSEIINYGNCTLAGPLDLYSLFSSSIPMGGTWSGPSTLTNGYLGTFDPASAVNGSYDYTYTTVCTTLVSTVNINIPSPLDLGPDTTICAGNAITLDAGPGYIVYDWSTGATTQSITVNSAGTYSVEAAVQMGNLVVNGDFEGGTTAAANNFTTAYIPGTGGAWGLLSNGGQYAISTSPSLTHSNFVVCGDHTTGTSNMFIANGSWIPNTVVWSQTVNVSPGTDYLFDFWAMNVVNNPNTSSLQLYINGVPISGVINTSTTPCMWQQMNGLWNSGASNTAVLEIINQSVAASGNDFALDDITFSPLCITTDTIVVTVESPTQIVNSTDPTCVGAIDGQITVDNSLATEYSIDGGTTWQIDSFFVGLPAGNYSVCSRTALGCEVCTNVVLLDPAPVTVSITNDTTVCENAVVALTAVGAGGTIFGYHWDFTADTAGVQVVNPTATSTYSVYAQNEFGCQSLPVSMTVTVLPPLSGTISLAQTICPGENATIVANISGGMGAPYDFTWSNGTVGTTGGTHSITVSPTDTMVYTVTITDGCESTPLVLSATVNVAPLPEPSYLITNPVQCEPAVFEIWNTTDPAMSDHIYWLIDGQYEYVDQDMVITPTLYAGFYDVQMIVTSPFGCVDSVTFLDAIEVLPKPEANFTWSPNPVLMFNTQVVLANGSTGADTYEWFIEDGNPVYSTVTNPHVNLPDGEVGEYEVMLIATSDEGCSDTLVKVIQVYPEVLIYAPNAFTPDGDEFNQNWRVYMEGIDLYQFDLTIYNRWGELIWQSNDIENAWDGTYNGQLVPTGTYTWVIHAKDVLNDGKYYFNGSVSILR